MGNIIASILFYGGAALMIYFMAEHGIMWAIIVIAIILIGGIGWPISRIKNNAKEKIGFAQRSAEERSRQAEKRFEDYKVRWLALQKGEEERVEKIRRKWKDEQRQREKDWLYKQEKREEKIVEKQEMLEKNWLEKQQFAESIWETKQECVRKQILKEINDNLDSREQAYKWLAPLIADVKAILKERGRQAEELVVSRRTSEDRTKIHILKNENRHLEEENAILRYQLGYIKTLIPETEDIIEYDEFKEEAEEADKSYRFISKNEYDLLTDREKNELALEHYKNRKKKKWEIGRDFERFVGYEYECLGYNVVYFGIEKQLEDLGRDLIAKKEGETLIVQCKYWSKNKVIHEKHIAQLFGTVAMYELSLECNSLFPEKVRGIFITHTTLSDEAKKFAKKLHIEIVEDKLIGEYPLIKCNVSKDEAGKTTRIYHLPMDQQYDTTIIDKKNGDCYAFTVEEAESKGFRRAWRHRKHGD